MLSGRTKNFPESGRMAYATLQFLAVRSAILATAWLLVYLITHLLTSYHDCGKRQDLYKCSNYCQNTRRVGKTCIDI